MLRCHSLFCNSVFVKSGPNRRKVRRLHIKRRFLQTVFKMGLFTFLEIGCSFIVYNVFLKIVKKFKMFMFILLEICISLCMVFLEVDNFGKDLL